MQSKMIGEDPMLELNKTSASNPIKQGTEVNFAADVLEASMSQPVIAYFSAPWCGPCKIFGPELEKSVREAKGAVTLVKFDVDQCQQLAAQLGIQSVPTVYGFFDGQLVDGFKSAQPASQIKVFLDKLIAMGGGDELADQIEAAEELLASGAAVEAAQRFAELLSNQKENAAAIGGLARSYLALGNIDTAKSIVDSVTSKVANAQEVLAAKAAIDLALQAKNAGPVDVLRAKVSADPNNHEARFELATALHANGNFQEAIDHLLELFQRNQEWRDGMAQTQLLKIFDALKPNDPMVLKGRRRLSSMIFS